MPAPVTVTPMMQRVRAYADQALAIPEGLTLHFKTSALGSLEAAATASRSFQITFGSLRAKADRMTQKHQGLPQGLRDSHVKGSYSQLACRRIQLPNGEGWRIDLCRGHALDMMIEVIDRSTGLPLKEFDPREQRLDHLIALVSEELIAVEKENRAFRLPLLEEEVEFMWEYSPIVAEGMWKDLNLALPSCAPGYIMPVVVNSEFDVASIPLDVDLFTGEALDGGTK